MKIATVTKFKETEIGPIPKEWGVCKLKDNILVKGRIGWKGLKKSEYLDSGFAIINGLQFKDDDIDWGAVGRISKERYEESPEIILKGGDILMTKDGTIGKLAYLKNLPEPATVASGVFVIRNNKNGEIDQNFLFQYFHSAYFKNLIYSRIEGAVIPHLYQRDINELLVPLPSINEQKQIAEILSSLEDKIKLDRQIVANLEKLADSLFRNWFVEFEFPDKNNETYKSGGGKMIDSDLGKIPHGWQVKSLDEVAKFLNGLALQKYPAKNGDEFLPVIKIRELKNGITNATDKASVKIDREYIVENGDIIFSWSGSLDVVIWCNGRGALNQHLFKVTSEKYPKWFYYQWIKYFLPIFQGIAEDKAVTMGHIKREHLTESKVLVPDERAFSKMNELMSPIIEAVINNSVELQNLSKIRDFLLPRLVSGKIRTPIKK